MPAWYWVSYLIIDSATGAQTGFGAIELETIAPRNANEVLQLADRVTAISHDKGILSGRHVFVQAWSRMGD